MTVMMPDKRHVEIKRSQMDAKCRNSRRRETNGECGNYKNSTDLSHDPAQKHSAIAGRRSDAAVAI